MSTTPPSPSSDPDAGVTLPNPITTNDNLITLSLGTRLFTTKSETLTSQSHFFKALLSSEWRRGDDTKEEGEADEAVFVDSDPMVFEHVLRYLRGGVLPVFWRRGNGFDYGLYALVLEQARFFGIKKLAAWIAEREYTRVVKVERETTLWIKEDFLQLSMGKESVETEIEYHPRWGKERVYICPRGIEVHRGRRDKCGRQCRNVQGDTETEYEVVEVLMEVLEVKKRMVVDLEMCLPREEAED